MKTYEATIAVTFTVTDEEYHSTAAMDIVGAIFHSGDEFADESHSVVAVEVTDVEEVK